LSHSYLYHLLVHCPTLPEKSPLPPYCGHSNGQQPSKTKQSKATQSEAMPSQAKQSQAEPSNAKQSQAKPNFNSLLNPA
jgi:hypothetical protein